MFGLDLFGLFGFDIEAIIKWGGVLLVALIIFAESGLLIGFFLPGDSLIFTAGFLVSQGILNFNIWGLAAILFVAAVAGDSVGYTFGHRVGRKLFKRKESLLFSVENLQKAEAFYEKHGGKTIIIARFIPIIRTFAPIVAGISKMHYYNFIAYNLIGGALWAGGITLAGYFLGSWFTSMGLGIDQVLLPAIIIILLISIAPPMIHILKDPKSRKAIKENIGIYSNKYKTHRTNKKAAKKSKKR